MQVAILSLLAVALINAGNVATAVCCAVYAGLLLYLWFQKARTRLVIKLLEVAAQALQELPSLVFVTFILNIPLLAGIGLAVIPIVTVESHGARPDDCSHRSNIIDVTSRAVQSH
jgi:Plasma-membrane choline transporter